MSASVLPPDPARSSTPTQSSTTGVPGTNVSGASAPGPSNSTGGPPSQNFSTLVSTILKTTGKEPAPLVGPSTTIVNDVLYVFGGRALQSRSTPKLTNDMYALDLVTRVWKKLETRGQIPPPRYFHSVCALGDAKLVCFGGMSPAAGVGGESANATGDGTQQVPGAVADTPEVMVMSDIHVFDIPTYTWTFIPAIDPPEGRYAHCATILPSRSFYSQADGVAQVLENSHRLDGYGGAEMVIVGGQDSANHYIEEINVFNLRSLQWISKAPLARSCGAYRSVVAPLGNRLAVSQIGAGTDASGQAEGGHNQALKEPGAMLIYSNYNFLDVKLALQVRLPDGTLEDRTMNGPHTPPGLRFPNGGVLDNHFVVSGTYLTSSKQEYALWALDLRTLVWSRIDAGQVFTNGSWNRGVVWNRRSSFLILGNKNRSLVDDYNHRRINFSNLCKVDLEAFGLYENWRNQSHPAVQKTYSPAAEEFGKMFMQMPELCDMEFICLDGESIPVNSRLVAKRWGQYFIDLLNNTKNDTDRSVSMATITPASFAGSSAASTLTGDKRDAFLPTPASYNPLDRPRALYFPHSQPIVAALTEFLYTGSLPPPGDPSVQAPILCSLLQIARPYRIEGLLEVTVERIHQQLDGKNAAAVFNAAATAAGSGSGIEAVYNYNPAEDVKEDKGEEESGEHTVAMPPLPGSYEDDEWWESVNIIGLQKRGLRGLMEGRRMRERGKSIGGPGARPEMEKEKEKMQGAEGGMRGTN
ncbi:hypothetical protein BZA77DRAFT_278366 [Pyronema omphalodes]|nr:hypothetical protein BZA77DRAFT_278366 [Pyronema omphalodes]